MKGPGTRLLFPPVHDKVAPKKKRGREKYKQHEISPTDLHPKAAKASETLTCSLRSPPWGFTLRASSPRADSLNRDANHAHYAPQSLRGLVGGHVLHIRELAVILIAKQPGGKSAHGVGLMLPLLGNGAVHEGGIQWSHCWKGRFAVVI